MYIAIFYALFALVSMACNLGSQAVVVHLYHGPSHISISIFVGTIVGLIAKYYLDKRYIFGFIAKNRVHDARIFFLYASMGIVTTAIFWGSEAIFQSIFNAEPARLIGGAIGLVIGYFVKYRLDKRYVFFVDNRN